MNLVKSLIVAYGLLLACSTWAAGEPLFINLTSDPQLHRTEMALGFANNVLKRSHPVTVFLNDLAVKTATKAAAGSTTGKLLADVLQAGGTVNVCPICMKHYSVVEADLIAGVKVGNPDITQSALFAQNTRTLSW
jgi:intracellular sulfur oxidation DsrE/DsrF family protein